MKSHDEVIADIEKNIKAYGYHLYLVAGGAFPRFMYTIGAQQHIGYELIFAGGAYFSVDEMQAILGMFFEEMKQSAGQAKEVKDLELAGIGRFSLQAADNSWVRELLLGAIDYHGSSEVSVLQIIPEKSRLTMDTPNLSEKLSVLREPAWKWYFEDWPFEINENSRAVTNLAALMGSSVTEAMRWADDEWELFSGNGQMVSATDIRVVPLGVMIALDNSLEIVTTLEVNKGVWRDLEKFTWNAWG